MKFVILFLSILTFSVPCFSDSELARSQFSEKAFDVANVELSEEWELETELGGTLTSGNTNTRTLKGKVNGSLEYLTGRITYLAEFYQKTVDEERSADKWKIGVKHNIHFDELSSSFTIFEYVQDKFSSAHKKATLAVGYTQRLFNDSKLLWNADVGPGLVRTTNEVEEFTKRIVHVGTQVKYKLASNTNFEQVLVADFDITSRDKSVYRSETSLSASVVDNLKMKLSYAVKYDSDVELFDEKLDTETSMSLVYIF